MVLLGFAWLCALLVFVRFCLIFLVLFGFPKFCFDLLLVLLGVACCLVLFGFAGFGLVLLGFACCLVLLGFARCLVLLVFAWFCLASFGSAWFCLVFVEFCLVLLRYAWFCHVLRGFAGFSVDFTCCADLLGFGWFLLGFGFACFCWFCLVLFDFA